MIYSQLTKEQKKKLRGQLEELQEADQKAIEIVERMKLPYKHQIAEITAFLHNQRKTEQLMAATKKKLLWEESWQK